MNEEKPINGTLLDGKLLDEALKHDDARKAAAGWVYYTKGVIEANIVPCEICRVREGVWCTGTTVAPLPNGEMVADRAHAERLALARADVSQIVQQKLETLRAGLPTGDELKAASGKWVDAIAYADLSCRQALAETLQRVSRELNVEPKWLVSLGAQLGGQQSAPVASPQSPKPTTPGPAVGKPSAEDRIERLEGQVEILRAMMMARG